MSNHVAHKETKPLQLISRLLPGMPDPMFSPPPPAIKPISSLASLHSNHEVAQLLCSIDWAFTDDNTNYLSHDIHPYPAKFIPQIPSNLIAALSLPGETVWDPFGGSGTTAFEALLLARQVISTDANPLAEVIARAKCSTLIPEDLAVLTRLANRMKSLAADNRDTHRFIDKLWGRVSGFVPPIVSIDQWFHPFVIRELAYLRSEIAALPNEACSVMANVALSAIVLLMSWQDGETRYAKRPREIGSGETLHTFSTQLLETLQKHEPIQYLLHYRCPTISILDIRQPFKNGKLGPVETESVDLVVTSPPYANATDYHLYHRFRLFWLGYSPTELAQIEIGSHLRHQRLNAGFALYAEEMSMALRNIHQALRPGRFAVLIVGDSVFEGKTIHSSKELSRLAESIGFEIVTDIERPIHETKRSFIVGARRARHESILVMRKKSAARRATLYPPPYKMWAYEDVLRKREITELLAKEVVPNRDGECHLLLEPFELDRVRRLTFTHHVKFEVGGSIRTWQAIVENGQASTGERNRKDPKYVTHGIHPYKGKFYPQLAKALFNLSGVPTNAWVLDPFCGSGTVLLESQLNGLQAAGIDMNPLAVLIARAKLSVCLENPYAIDTALKDFIDEIATDRSCSECIDRFPPNSLEEILQWFPGAVVQKLGWLLTEIERVPNLIVQEALRVCLSSIIREVSQQHPNDLRIRRRKEAIADAPALELFTAKVKELRLRLRQFAERAPASPNIMKPATVLEGDSRDTLIYAKIAPPGGFNLVVTSPPYATALPYIDTDRLSLLVLLGMRASERSRLEEALTGSREIRVRERRALGTDMALLSSELVGSELAVVSIREIHERNVNADVGFRRRNMSALLLRYCKDMYKAFQAVEEHLASSAQVFVVIGDNKTVAGGTEVCIPTTEILAQQGQTLGWELKERIPITVTKENLLHSKHSITQNTVLWFCKK
jgi:DNA modification methylase